VYAGFHQRGPAGSSTVPAQSSALFLPGADTQFATSRSQPLGCSACSRTAESRAVFVELRSEEYRNRWSATIKLFVVKALLLRAAPTLKMMVHRVVTTCRGCCRAIRQFRLLNSSGPTSSGSRSAQETSCLNAKIECLGIARIPTVRFLGHLDIYPLGQRSKTAAAFGCPVVYGEWGAD